MQQHDRAGGVALGRPQLVYEVVDVSHERGRYSVRHAVDQPLLVLLLPQRLERFHLEQPVRELLRAPGVVAVDPSRLPLARMVPTVAARAAIGPGEAHEAAGHAGRGGDPAPVPVLPRRRAARPPSPEPSSGTAGPRTRTGARARRGGGRARRADDDARGAARGRPAADGGARDRQRPAERTRGPTPRRMSAMLCVICATSGSVPAALRPLGQPDADLDALAEPRRGQRRQRLARQLARSASALARSAVGDVLAERGQHLGAARLGPRGGLLEPAEGVEHAVRAGQQAERGILGERGERQRRAAVVRRARVGHRLEAGAERIRRRRLRRPREPVLADPHAAAQRLGAEARQPPAGLDVAAQPARERARDPAQRAGQHDALAVGGARVARARERDVRGQVVADPRAVEEDEQRRGLGGERGRDAPGPVDHARPLHRAAGLERVRQPVAVVVDLVDAEPRQRRRRRRAASRAPGTARGTARSPGSGRSGAPAGRRRRCRAARAC